MKWWIPLVVALSLGLLAAMLILFVCWRRGKAKKEKEDGLEELQQEMDVQKDDGFLEEDHTRNVVDQRKVEVPMTITTIPMPTKKEGQVMALERKEGAVEALRCVEDEKEKMETVLVDGKDTLFNRLHSKDGGDGKRHEVNGLDVKRELVCGLHRLSEHYPLSPVLWNLSPHWILIDSKDRLCFKTADLTQTQPQSHPTRSHNVVQESNHESSFFDEAPSAISGECKHDDKAEQNDEPEVVTEGARWEAPECGVNKQGVDQQAGLVFRLAILLWEIETGQVPFGEYDASNAQRQIRAGMTPNVDLIATKEERELISSCLSFDPQNRPNLSSLLNFYLSPPKPQVEHLLELHDQSTIRQDDAQCSTS
ncbi:hypothetical protein BLNAU_16836 [Blattamonas nauphoetae]|uniref:Protein kinase domain-containing protein n=1 Tax=Blattamonas nauphoetae TaxID=2049346 RepID=A0ABQ9X820_9EUKA|nr:hypothetical protein BLNAU_16836 [Blattamonas nauphoetae]